MERIMKNINLSEVQWMRITRHENVLTKKTEDIYCAPESAISEEEEKEELWKKTALVLINKEGKSEKNPQTSWHVLWRDCNLSNKRNAYLNFTTYAHGMQCVGTLDFLGAIDITKTKSYLSWSLIYKHIYWLKSNNSSKTLTVNRILTVLFL